MSQIQLPSHWKLVELKDIAVEIFGGGTPSTKTKDFWDGSIPWTTTAIIDNDDIYLTKYQRCITDKGLKNSSSKIAPKGSILIGSRVGVGKAVVATFDTAINQDITVVISNLELLPDFLALQFKISNLQAWFSDRKRGTTIKGVPRGDVLRIPVILPPLPEQGAIAHTLLTIQKAKESRQRELELERERKAALMQYLFTHGTRNQPCKKTELGEIPESWQVVKLEDLLREPLKNGHSAIKTDSQEGVRTLTLTAVTKNNFSIENTKLTTADPNKVKDIWLQSGDILIERSNTYEMVGLAALYEGPSDFAIYPDLMVRVRVKEDKLNPKFLVEFLLNPFCRNYFKKNASGTAGNMPKIDQGVIRRVPIPLPSAEEQREIDNAVRSFDRKITALEQETAFLDELFRAMLEEMMTGHLSALPLVEEKALN